MSRASLNARQARFVDLYVTGLPAATAAKEAGYAHHYARRAASHLLGQPAIRAAVDEAQQRLREAAVYDADKAVAECDVLIAFATSKGNPMAAVKALELKTRLLGLLIEKHHLEIERPDIAPILEAARRRVEDARIVNATAIESGPDS